MDLSLWSNVTAKLRINHGKANPFPSCLAEIGNIWDQGRVGFAIDILRSMPQTEPSCWHNVHQKAMWLCG